MAEKFLMVTDDNGLAIKRKTADEVLVLADLKSAIDRNAVPLVDDNDIAISVLENKNGTNANVDYSLVGETLTLNGTASSGGIISIVGGGTSIPAFIKPGKSYALTVTVDSPIEVEMQYKPSSDASFVPLVTITESGVYIFSIPSIVYAVRFAARIIKNNVYNNASITFRFSDIVYRESIDYVTGLDRWRYYGDTDQLVIPWSLSSTGNWITGTDRAGLMIPVSAGDIIVFTADDAHNGYYALLTDDNHRTSKTAALITGTARVTVYNGTSVSFTIPETCKYLYVLVAVGGGTKYTPASLIVNGIDLMINIRSELKDLKDSVEKNTVGVNRYEVSGSIKSTGMWGDVTSGRSGSLLIPVTEGDAVSITASDRASAYYALLTSNSRANGVNADFVADTSRVTLAKGATVALTIPQTCTYLSLLDYLQDTSYRPKSIVLNGEQLAEGLWGAVNELKTMVNAVSIKIKAIYESGPFDGIDGVTEKLTVFCPVEDHFVAWEMRHYVLQDINCNCWRVFMAYRVESDLETTSRLLNTGEIECAVRLKDRSDFSGGSTHGDEVMTGYEIFLDGKNITSSVGTALADYTDCSCLRFVRQSNLYDPADSTTIIAEHGCEYVFTAEGLKINQSLKWKGAYDLTNCYMAMFTPSKTVTNHVYTDLDFDPIDLSGQSNFRYFKDGVKKTVIYGNNAVMDFAIERYPTGKVGGDKWSCTDNNGINYNKIYYYVSDNGATCQENELWQSTSVYKVLA